MMSGDREKFELPAQAGVEAQALPSSQARGRGVMGALGMLAGVGVFAFSSGVLLKTPAGPEAWPWLISAWGGLVVFLAGAILASSAKGSRSS